MKKILTVCLSLALLLGLFLTTGSLQLSAATEKVWVDAEIKPMDYHVGDYGWDAWSIDQKTPYRAATWKNWGYVYGSTYANIRKLVVPETGTIAFETIWGAGIFSDDTESFEFAILDKNKQIVWPENGVPYKITGKTVDNGDGSTTTKPDGLGQYWDSAAEALANCSDSLSYTANVTAGDEFYFVFMNGNSQPTNYTATVIIRNNGTQINASGGYLCADDFTQGGTVGETGVEWYYMYADSVNLTTVDPNGCANEGKGEYTVDYNDSLVPMHKINTANGDPNTGWLGDGAYNQTVFASGMGVYFGGLNHTFVVRYTPAGPGDFRIGYGGVQLRNSWTAGTGIDFCIVDQDGKIVYPASGGPVELRADSDDPFAMSTAMAYYQSNMQVGDYLDFVFIPRGSLAASYAKYVYMAGSFTHTSETASGNRVDSSGRLFLSNGESQGSRNVQMFTASNVTVNQVTDGVWEEFVQLEEGLTAAPSTVEGWVNIAESTPDWKVGTILSDMTGTDDNGFAVLVDTFGHPRLVSGNIDWTVDSVDLRTGEWQHIAFTVDGNTATFYQNGVAVATTTLTEAAPAVTGRAPLIGGDLTYASTTAFQGAMKKLALFSDARTADEIAADMNGLSASAEGLTNYWVLNGVYTDKTGNNNGSLTAVNASWYENGKLADAGEGEYTIVHIGDNQVVTDFYRGGYQKITQWIADNAARLNIQMVLNSGDLVNYSNYASGDTTNDQWKDAVEGMNILKDAGIPYVYAPGNHEYKSSGTSVPRTSEEFNDHFDIVDHLLQAEGAENETKLVYAYPNTNKISSTADLTLLENATTTSYGNTYEETMENAFYLATIGGKQYAILALECQPRKAVTAWAGTILTAIEAEYPGITTIVVTHDYLSNSGTLVTYASCFDAADRAIAHTPASLYSDFLSQYKSISMVYCGHVATGIATRTDIGVNGNKIVTIMNDQSYEGNGGEGNILLLRCKADGTVIKAEYYSPILEKYYVPQYQFDFDTASDSEVQLTLPKLTLSTNVRSNKDAWLHSTWSGGTLCGNRLLAAYTTYSAVRAYQVQNTGTMNYRLNYDLSVAASNGAVELTLCRADGTILWPQTGAWQKVTGTFDTTVSDIPVVAGEQIYLIIRNINATGSSGMHYINITSSGTVKDAVGSTLESFNSNSSTTGLFTKDTDGNVVYAQGHNHWYAYTCTGTSIKTTAKTYDVTYGVDGEGGTLSAATSGTASTGKCVVAAGGTVRFTALPAVGYRIVGYYVDGAYYKSTRRILTLPMIEKDMDVKVVFEKIPLEGDANGDGTVDVLDAVHLKVGVETEAEIEKAELCDLIDEIAATIGVDVLDNEDIRALRKKILGI